VATFFHSIYNKQRVVKEPASGSDLEPTVAVKDPKEVGCGSERRPSDPDAGYSGHKGKGYQAQICETFDPDADPNDKSLNLFTHVNSQKASEQDCDAPELVIEDLAAKNILPETLEADTSRGRDANRVFAMKNWVNLISPVADGRPRSNAGVYQGQIIFGCPVSRLNIMDLHLDLDLDLNLGLGLDLGLV
jgi:hypothetical protein